LEPKRMKQTSLKADDGEQFVWNIRRPKVHLDRRLTWLLLG
jgi:hypothetical protein